jgi:hypothetical protein
MARNPDATFLYEVSEDVVVRAAAEAHAAGAKALIKTDPAGHKRFEQIQAFLQQVPAREGKAMYNIAVTDDGSAAAGEALNLLSRRNLLFHIVKSGDPAADVNVKAAKDIGNPLEWAQDVRQKLGDGKRLVRVYGSDVVLAALYRTADGVRLHLLNYGKRPVPGVRVRLLGEYRSPKAFIFEAKNEGLADVVVANGATEFTIPSLPVYGVIDLTGGH